jgi:hypothetical protein
VSRFQRHDSRRYRRQFAQEVVYKVAFVGLAHVGIVPTFCAVSGWRSIAMSTPWLPGMYWTVQYYLNVFGRRA